MIGLAETPLTRTIEIDGVLWRYHLAGNGQREVLLFSGSLGTSSGMAQFLSQALTGARIIAPDHAPVTDVASYLRAIESICEAEHVGNSIVYGSSLGSLIAQCWVRRHRDRVSHLILSGGGVPDASRAASNRRWLKALPFIPVAFIKLLLRMILRKLLRGSMERNFWMLEYRSLIEQINKRDLLARYLLAIDFDSKYVFRAEDLSGWPGRILLLHGESDRISGEKTFAHLKSLYPQAAQHTVKGAGHSALLTHPEDWKRAITGFLDSSL